MPKAEDFSTERFGKAHTTRDRFRAYSNILQAELYPRRRKTRFFFVPPPNAENQTKIAEHPARRLKHISNNNVCHGLPIVPPSSDDTEYTRNSYFS